MNAQKNQSNYPLIVFSLALGAIIAIGAASAFFKPLDQIKKTPPPSRQDDSVTYQKELVPRDKIISHVNTNEFAYVEGQRDASVTVVEYFDFMCPFSAQSAQTMSSLLETYKTSPVRFIFRHVPGANINPAALSASNASLCAKEQGKFLPMYSLLFEQQKKIKEDDFSFFADALGLDRVAFDACMDQRKYQKWISKDLSDAVALKLQGTPTWFINGKRFIGAMPLTVLSNAIDNELGAIDTKIK